MGIWARIGDFRVRVIWLVPAALAALIFFVGPTTFTILVLISAVALAVGAFLRDMSPKGISAIEGAAAFFSCLALILAGYWYFVDRRGIPKMNLTPSIEAWPIGNGRAFVRVELLLENVGNSAITIGPSDPFRLEIGQVMPLRGTDAKKLSEAFHEIKPGGQPLEVLRTDRWPTKARIKNGLDVKIESGETEKRYFKAIVPCEDGLILNARADVPKNLNWFQDLLESGDEQIFWRGQAISDVIESCEGEMK